MSPGTLYMVATPIGNLADISQRALSILEEVDVVLAEDTRVTGRLLAHFGISTSLERCDENVIAQRSAAIVSRLQEGTSFAFCSDAGTPAVSDPGMVLADAALIAGIPVVAVPGASALLCAVASSGLDARNLYFGGFLPRKAGERRALLESLAPLDATLVFYESPHRTLVSLSAIAEIFPTREAVMARELTKLHEEIVRDSAPELARRLSEREGELKGEVVLLIGPPGLSSEAGTAVDDASILEMADCLAREGLSKSAVARRISQETGVARGRVYDLIVGRDAGGDRETQS